MYYYFPGCDDDVVHVVAHSNRPEPPIRQRVTSPVIADNRGTNSEKSSEDDEQLHRRMCSRVSCVVTAPSRRRSYTRAHSCGHNGWIWQERH